VSAPARFRFRAYAQSGGHDSGYVMAADRADAVRQLSQAGKIPYELKQVDGSAAAPASSSSFFGLFQPKLDLTHFLSELSVIIGSGFNVDIALKAVADAETNKGQKARIQAIHSQITEGKSVAEAFASQPSMPPEVVALVASGESSGRLDVVVSELAKTHALRAKRRSEITEAMIYPAFLLLIMVGALLVLSLYLVPALEPIFTNAGAEPPFIVRALGGVGETIKQFGFLILAGLGGLALLLAVFFQRPATKARLMDVAARIPVISGIVRSATRERYLNTMSLLLGNGVPMLDAMNLAADTAPSAGHKAKLLQARQRVASGEPIWQALKSSDAFPDPILSLVRLGEESNNLAVMMGRSGTMTQVQMQRTISRALSMLTPAMTIVLGGLVGSLVISVMTTLLSINEMAIR
jgi:general secretion pathway protein F